MSLSAQYDSQVTPDTGVCKNPYRQRSPKRTYLPITGLYMFTYLKARQSFFHVRLLFQPVSRWPVRIFVAAWPYAATKEQGLEHSNVGLELVHTNTHTHTHTYTNCAVAQHFLPVHQPKLHKYGPRARRVGGGGGCCAKGGDAGEADGCVASGWAGGQVGPGRVSHITRLCVQPGPCPVRNRLPLSASVHRLSHHSLLCSCQRLLLSASVHRLSRGRWEVSPSKPWHKPGATTAAKAAAAAAAAERCAPRLQNGMPAAVDNR